MVIITQLLIPWKFPCAWKEACQSCCPGQGFTAVSRDCDSEPGLSHGWCLNALLEPPI